KLRSAVVSIVSSIEHGIPTDQPCRCGHCKEHKKGCKYIVIKCLIMKEYLSIPIIGL
ncbi:hypothetical protein PROFUN_04760, partial [Planoprotostelium fungivorum]